MRTYADEVRSPKYSHVERERRFLVNRARLPALPDTAVLIEDRYITGTRLRLRRMTDEVSGEVAHKLAKKYEATDATARPMVNAYLTAAEYDVFAALPAAVVRKRRFPVTSGPHVFGVDLFDGALAGLVLAEVDAEDAATLGAVDAPSRAIGEVTHDPRYQGGALALADAQAAAALIAP